jgi:hypothetical protein
MALIVEDGTVVADANSFVSVAEADTFFENQQSTLWIETATDEAKEAALVKAALYMQQKFRMLWMGSIIDATQSLSWPRRGVPVQDFFDPFYTNVNVPRSFQNTYYIAENVIPEEVKQCQLLLAINTLDSSGQATGSLQAAFGRKTKREKAGELEVEYMTAEEGGNTAQTQTYWDAMKIVEPFLRPSQPHTGTILRS